MARKESSKRKKNTSKGISSFIYPTLHHSVCDAVSGSMPIPWFNEIPDDKTYDNEYSTNIMGRFQCINNNCSATGWGSKMIGIVIRGYTDNGYNAVVFNQRCKSCNWLGWPTLDKESYVDRVAYRLKKWAGV